MYTLFLLDLGPKYTEYHSLLTSRNTVNLVLDKVINERYQGPEEQPGKDFAVLDGFFVGLRGEQETANRPRQSEDQVSNHENVMPVMVVRRSNVNPSTAGNGTEKSDREDKLGSECAGTGSQEKP